MLEAYTSIVITPRTMPEVNPFHRVRVASRVSHLSVITRCFGRRARRAVVPAWGGGSENGY